jgi:monovalent cation:H+ antiporter-2, CPA2 family
VYGDASSSIVLEQTYPQGMDLAVVALPELSAAELAVQELRRLAPQLPIIARVHRRDEIPRMKALGADVVIHAEFEAAMEIVQQGLERLGFPGPEVRAFVASSRYHSYRRLVREALDDLP